MPRGLAISSSPWVHHMSRSGIVSSCTGFGGEAGPGNVDARQAPDRAQQLRAAVMAVSGALPRNGTAPTATPAAFDTALARLAGHHLRNRNAVAPEMILKLGLRTHGTKPNSSGHTVSI
jgi:hypothetical protein